MSDATTTVTSNGNYEVVIDNNNTETDRIWAVKHDGATELMRVQENGNVGIGNAAPTEQFVVGPGTDASAVSQTLAMITSTGAVNLALRDSGDDVEGMVFVDSGGTSVGSYTNHSLFLRTNNTPGLTLTNAQKVGIGTTGPLTLLQVGDGGDTPATSGTLIYAAQSGATSVVARNTSDDIEIAMVAGTTVGGVGMQTNHALQLITNATERARITAAGDVGIGTTAPVSRLHVAAAADGAESLIDIENTISTASSIDEYSGIRFLHNGSGAVKILAGKEEDFTVAGNRTGFLGFHIRQDGTYHERMRIGSNGYINTGIAPGVSAPTYQFEMMHDEMASLFVGSHSTTGTGGRASLRLFGGRGSYLSPSANQSGDIFGEVLFMGWDTGRTVGGAIYAKAAANWGTASDSSDAPTDLYFATAADASETVTDRMVIKSDGRVGIGTVTPKTGVALTVGSGYYGSSGDEPIIGTPALHVAVNGEASLSLRNSNNTNEIAMIATEGEGGLCKLETTQVAGIAFVVASDEIGKFYNDENFRHVLEVRNHLFCLSGNDPGFANLHTVDAAISIKGAQERLTWHDETTGYLQGYHTVNSIKVPPTMDFVIEHFTHAVFEDGYVPGGERRIWKSNEDYRVILNPAVDTDEPEGGLHVIHQQTSGGFICGFIVTGCSVNDANPHNLLSAGDLSSTVTYRFAGKVIVRRTGAGGGANIAVDIDVAAGGAAQTVTTDSGNSVDFSVSSNALIVQRSAGSGTFLVGVTGMWM